MDPESNKGVGKKTYRPGRSGNEEVSQEEEYQILIREELYKTGFPDLTQRTRIHHKYSNKKDDSDYYKPEEFRERLAEVERHNQRTAEKQNLKSNQQKEKLNSKFQGDSDYYKPEEFRERLAEVERHKLRSAQKRKLKSQQQKEKLNSKQQLKSQSSESDDDDDEDENSLVKVTFHAAMVEEEYDSISPETLHLTFEIFNEKWEAKTFTMKEIKRLSIEDRHFVLFQRQVNIPLNFLKGDTKKKFSYSVKENIKRLIRLQWKSGRPDPLLHHYDGLVTSNYDQLDMRNSIAIAHAMLPQWNKLKIKTKGMSATTFLQQIEQVYQQCICVGSLGQATERIYVKYIRDKMAKLNELKEDKSISSRSIVSVLIILHLCEEYGIGISQNMAECFNFFLAVQPNSSWIDIFTDIQDVHFQHEYTRKILTKALKFHILVQAEKVKLFDILKLLPLLHYMQGYHIIIEDQSNDYSCSEWWGFGEIEGLPRIIQKQGNHRISTKEREDIVAVAINDRMLLRALMYFLDIQMIEDIVQNIPLELLIGMWYLWLKRENVTSCKWIMVAVSDRLNDRKKQRGLTPVECMTIGKYGKETIASSTIKDYEENLYFISKFLNVFVGDEEAVVRFQSDFQQCFAQHIAKTIKNGFQLFYEIQDFWKMVFKLKLADESRNKQWQGYFQRLYASALSKLHRLTVVKWFCLNETQTLMNALPEGCTTRSKQIVTNLCREREQEDHLIKWFERNLHEQEFDGKIMNDLLLILLIEQTKMMQSVDSLTENDTFERILELFASQKVALNQVPCPPELSTSKEDLEEQLVMFEKGDISKRKADILFDNRVNVTNIWKILVKLNWMESKVDLEEIFSNYELATKKVNILRSIFRDVQVMIEAIQPVEADIFKRNQDFDQLDIPLSDIFTWPYSDGDNTIEYFNIPEESLEMFTTIYQNNLQNSSIFKLVWTGIHAEYVKDQNMEEKALSVDEVTEVIWEPSRKMWKQVCRKFHNGSISVKDVKDYLSDIQYDPMRVKTELAFMKVPKETKAKLFELIELLFKLHRMEKFLEVLHQFQNTYELNVEVVSKLLDDDMQLASVESTWTKLETRREMISTFTKDQTTCIEVYVKCSNLVKWLQNTLKGEEEVNNLIDIAMASVKGQAAHEVMRANILCSALNGYTPLLFHLNGNETTLQQLISSCKNVADNLKKDPHIYKNLETLDGLLPWLKHIRGISSANNILTNSVIHIGHNTECDGTLSDTLDMDDIIKVQLTSQHKEWLSFSELVDIHSKIVLIVRSDEANLDEQKDRGNFAVFQEIMEILEQIGRLCILFHDRGNLCFSKFTMNITNHEDESTIDVTIREIDIPTYQCSRFELPDNLSFLAATLKICLKCWSDHIESLRKLFYYLNYFEDRQLRILRLMLAEDMEFTMKDVQLLYAVKPGCTKYDITKAKEAAKKAPKIDPINTADYFLMKKRDCIFKTEIESCCRQSCGLYDNDTKTYLSVRHVGKFLQELSEATSAERKLEIQKLSQETFYAVRNKREDIDELVDITVDTYWEKRRYGESWDDLEVPATLFKPEDQGSNLESKSRRSYKRLIFDLVGEIIKDIYKDEDKEEITVPPWEKPHTTKYKYFKGKKPPTTLDDLKPLVIEHARKILSVDKDSQVDTKKMKLGGHKKKDNVDEILTRELGEEEPDWVNYDKDELAVKNEIADSILVSLLFETVTVCASSYENKMARVKSSC